MPSDHPDASRSDDSEPGLDVDAAFAEIVARWEPSPPSPDDVEAPPVVPRAEPPVVARPEPVLDEEEHFVPPPPPPLPKLDPRRKLAWIGVLGAPALALVLVVLGVVVAPWVEVGMVVAFVGGFGYLVATMRSSPPDPWSGDDGAVL